MKMIPVIALSVVLALPAHAIIITELPRVYAGPAAEIADVQNPPQLFLQTITDSAILFITDIQVSVRLVGIEDGMGFASEMFVSLNKDLAATSVLLNRVGLSPGNSMGAFYDGWDVTFRDTAQNGDIHTSSLAAGILDGLWQPDGRTDSTGSTRPQMLSVFNGYAGNGDWRLAVGDLEAGGRMRLENWSITLTGETGQPIPVQDGGSTLLLAGFGVFAVSFLARRKVHNVGNAQSAKLIPNL